MIRWFRCESGAHAGHLSRVHPATTGGWSQRHVHILHSIAPFISKDIYPSFFCCQTHSLSEANALDFFVSVVNTNKVCREPHSTGIVAHYTRRCEIEPKLIGTPRDLFPSYTSRVQIREQDHLQNLRTRPRMGCMYPAISKHPLPWTQPHEEALKRSGDREDSTL